MTRETEMLIHLVLVMLDVLLLFTYPHPASLCGAFAIGWSGCTVFFLAIRGRQ